MRQQPTRCSCVCLRALICLALVSLTQPGTAHAQGSGRDAWQRVPDVVATLELQPGGWVADIGAGSGYFVPHLAAAVGTGGRVFAVEISQPALSQLGRLVEDEGLENVEVVRGEVDDPRLPERSLHAVLVVDAYHEMTKQPEMLAHMYHALEPGGRLAVLDLAPYDASTPREHQMEGHGIGMGLVERDLREAGFEVLERRAEFTTSGRGRRQWMLVGRRPVG
jgi:arsenite methyltransferase